MIIEEIINKLNNTNVNICGVVLLVVLVFIFAYLFGRATEFKANVFEIMSYKDYLREKYQNNDEMVGEDK